MTTIKELKALGGFVPEKPVLQEIEYKLDGESYRASIYVKRLGIGEYEALFMSVDDKRSRTALTISQAISLGAEGKERISFEDAYRLRPELAGAMLNAFNEVNVPKKSSGRATDSSASLPSASE